MYVEEEIQAAKHNYWFGVCFKSAPGLEQSKTSLVSKMLNTVCQKILPFSQIYHDTNSVTATTEPNYSNTITCIWCPVGFFLENIE